ncbi:MAG: hypothetical protein AAGA54_05035 [Myxococcota bacterium]
MRPTLLLALSLGLLTACDDAPASEDRPATPPAAGKADDAGPTDPEISNTVVLPLPDVEAVRSTFLGFTATGAGAVSSLDATGHLYGPTAADCPELEAIYGEPGRTLCEGGVLGLPVVTADRLPTVTEGVVELWAQAPAAEEPTLGHPMLLLDLEAGELLAPEVGTLDRSRTTVVDVVRRVQVTADGVVVWSRDPDNLQAPPLSATLDRPSSALAVLVLPDPAPVTEPGALAPYDYTLSMRCEAEQDCVFGRPE